MENLNLTLIGKVTKTYKLKGEIIIQLNKMMEFDLNNINLLFIEQNNSYLPYQIISKKKSEFKLYVLLKNITDINQAKLLINKDCYLLKEFVKELEIDYLKYQLNYQNNNYQIIDQMFNGKYWLFKVLIKQEYIWVPNVPEYIQTIDENNKIIIGKNIERLI